MNKLLIVLVLIALVLWRAVYVEESLPDQWQAVWSNFEQSESVGGLAEDVFDTLSGEPIDRVALSADAAETVVYKWVDSWGQAHISYQKPVGVDNVEEIRLGDLDYQVKQSLSKREIDDITSSAKDQ